MFNLPPSAIAPRGRQAVVRLLSAIAHRATADALAFIPLEIKIFTQADTIEKSVKIAQDHCEKLTQSILVKAFRGELVGQNLNDEPADILLAKIVKKK